MTILALVRNFVPAHEQIERGDWDVAAVAKGEYDLEGKVVGTVGVGRIGERVLRRLRPFECGELLYFDYQPLSPEKEREIGCRRVGGLEEMLAVCDVVTINCPLHERTRGLFDEGLVAKMKRGRTIPYTQYTCLLYVYTYIYTIMRGSQINANDNVFSRCLARQHCPWRHRRQGGRRQGSRVWPSARLRRRRLVPATGTQGTPAPVRKASVGRRQRDGATHVGYQHRRAETVCGRGEGDPGELLFRQGGLSTRRPDCA